MPEIETWLKCAHTCRHAADHKSRIQNRQRVYTYDGQQISVATVPVWHKHSSLWKKHAGSHHQHPNCDQNCPLHHLIGANPLPPVVNLRAPLTPQDWRRWGLAIALRVLGLKYEAEVPQNYVQRAQQFQEQGWPAWTEDTEDQDEEEEDEDEVEQGQDEGQEEEEEEEEEQREDEGQDEEEEDEEEEEEDEEEDEEEQGQNEGQDEEAEEQGQDEEFELEDEPALARYTGRRRRHWEQESQPKEDESVSEEDESQVEDEPARPGHAHRRRREEESEVEEEESGSEEDESEVEDEPARPGHARREEESEVEEEESGSEEDESEVEDEPARPGHARREEESEVEEEESGSEEDESEVEDEPARPGHARREEESELEEEESGPGEQESMAEDEHPSSRYASHPRKRTRSQSAAHQLQPTLDVIPPLFPRPVSLAAGVPPIKITFVQNLGHSYDTSLEAQGTIYWCKDYIPKSVYRALKKALPSSVYRLPKNQELEQTEHHQDVVRMKDPVYVHIDEWTYMVAALMERPAEFQVELMRWKDFMQVISQGTESRVIWGADLIICGLDFSEDFLGPACAQKYGWDKQSFKLWFENWVKVSTKKAVWPSPWECLMYADKLSYLSDLAEVAREAGYMTPMIALLDPGKLEELSPTGVYKRGYSESGDGVWFPGRDDPDRQVLQTLKDKDREVEECYGGLEINGVKIRPQWFQMTFLSTLKNLGELRAVYVGGKLMHIAFTVGGGLGRLVFADAVYITPLYALPDDLSDGRVNAWQAEEGRAKFTQFAETILRGMISKRERGGKFLSSDMRTFCRMDISVFRAPDGGYHHFVNEFETGPGSGLFLESLTIHKRRMIRQTMGDVWMTKAIYRRRQSVL
ncbi:hypothetical protein D9615_006311 [Tricholomella constricta]|uniref:Uncharacterized protein n=1 Tax=Tricholomella constricta TaxID=117010 RepID=A0A8H5M453_9AGAR|nr:hypothetical protein D9615_006311 [Tricholomella constricta]